jgi:hypothetical protein
MTPGQYWIDEGTISEVVVDGVPLVRFHDTLTPMASGWHDTKAGAQADVVKQLAKQIGGLQAKLDAIRDQMLHEILAAEDVALALTK